VAHVRVDRARAGRYARSAGRWARLATPGRIAPGLRVSFGHDRIPRPDEPARGGTAKFQRLAYRYPNHPADFTALYLGSSWLPRDLRPLLWAARRRHAPVVVNQNGVGYPAWAGERTDAINAPLRRALRSADHVLYQSAFAKAGADLYLGPCGGTWELLPNAVDVERFTPAEHAPEAGPVLLLGGDQTQAPDRVRLALRTLAALRSEHHDARLLIAGRVDEDVGGAVAQLGVADAVELVGRYRQSDAPDLMRRAHVLLHTQLGDCCPSVVLEAMACGVPVVHPASGGTPELVADEGGIGVPHEQSWTRLVPPPADQLADAVSRVLAEHDRYRTAARRRAVEHYALEPWLARHDALFAELLARPATR
jgi:glycosyltransferase involved in cell wall biosynthesis